jgi:stage III sporulation protein AG
MVFTVKNIGETLKKYLDKLSEKSRLGKGVVLAVVLLLSGVIMLIISEIVPEEKSVSAESESSVVQSDTDEYVRLLEERLVSIISSVYGAGETRVMVTLESGSEDVYLHNYDYGENSGSDGRNSFERKDEYVIVDGSSGEQGIVVRQSEPKIRGVAVVCEGGGNQTVKQQIIETVTALLDISSARVSVAKMN